VGVNDDDIGEDITIEKVRDACDLVMLAIVVDMKRLICHKIKINV
jgi:hypothetical protein